MSKLYNGNLMLCSYTTPVITRFITTLIAFVVTIIGALRSFDLISIMTNGGPFGSTRVLSFYMFERSLSEYGFKMGYGAAISVILFLIMLLFIAYFLWRMYQDEKEAR